MNLIHISPIFRQQAILMGKKMVFEKKKSGRIPLLNHHLGVTWDDHRTRGLDSGISWSKVGTCWNSVSLSKNFTKKHIRKAEKGRDVSQILRVRLQNREFPKVKHFHFGCGGYLVWKTQPCGEGQLLNTLFVMLGDFGYPPPPRTLLDLFLHPSLWFTDVQQRHLNYAYIYIYICI